MSAPKCMKCAKSVYKNEEVRAIGGVWHTTCFCCGALSSDGCHRVLKLDQYLEHLHQPFCKACYDKLYRPVGYGYSNTLSSYSHDKSDHPAEIPVPINAGNADANSLTKLYNAAEVSKTVQSSHSSTHESTIAHKDVQAHAPTHHVAHATPSHPVTVSSGGGNKCYLCQKTVYKVEELISHGRMWHKTCFTCGGAAKDGCGRVLTSDGASEHDSQPYCKACFLKMFDPKGIGMRAHIHAPAPASAVHQIEQQMKDVHISSSPASAHATEPVSVPHHIQPVAVQTHTESAHVFTKLTTQEPVLIPAQVNPKTGEVTGTEKKKVVPNFLAGGGGTPKCTICGKSVYKAEEIKAMGQIWHTACFTCGGGHSDGCGRTLKLDKYFDHESRPYCNACYAKNFKPKGFNGAVSNTGIVNK